MLAIALSLFIATRLQRDLDGAHGGLDQRGNVDQIRHVPESRAGYCDSSRWHPLPAPVGGTPAHGFRRFDSLRLAGRQTQIEQESTIGSRYTGRVEVIELHSQPG